MEHTRLTHGQVGLDHMAVSAVRCSDYEIESVQEALRKLMDPLGGMSAFVKPGERIALKPNLLMPSTPERAIVTHPAVLAAVALAVKEAGGHPVVTESPGGGVVNIKPVIERAFRKVGYLQAAEKYGFEISLDTDWEVVSYPEAYLAKRLEVLSHVLRADGVINLAKFKTHVFMTFTGATKNLFGVIPGLNKAAYHASLADPMRFAHMLLDLAGLVRPRLNIVDGILAMEGDGPGISGTPRPLGVLVAGADTVTVDVACCRIAGIDPAAVQVLVAAHERGMWSGRAADVDTLGVPVAELQVKDYLMPGAYKGIGVGLKGLPNAPLRAFLRRLDRLPRPKVGRCTLCRTCERACPGKAITMDKAAKVAKVDDSLCIRCYCCHELCPSAAIDLEFIGVGRVMKRLGMMK
jgi:uncharacterized protein (DUF362 family)